MKTKLKKHENKAKNNMKTEPKQHENKANMVPLFMDPQAFFQTPIDFFYTPSDYFSTKRLSLV